MTSICYFERSVRFSARCAFFCAQGGRKKMYRNYYIAPGTLANLQRAFNEGYVWGLPEGRIDTWHWLRTGDIAFFYAEMPTSAVVACGEIQNTFFDRTSFFPD